MENSLAARITSGRGVLFLLFRRYFICLVFLSNR